MHVPATLGAKASRICVRAEQNTALRGAYFDYLTRSYERSVGSRADPCRHDSSYQYATSLRWRLYPDKISENLHDLYNKC